MEDTSGFYKFDGDLLFGHNFVLNANYELRRETHDQHTYPIDGWYWFDTVQEARLFFGLPAPEPEAVEQIDDPLSTLTNEQKLALIEILKQTGL